MWNDTTSFAQGDIERKPTTWTLKSGHLKVVVTSGYLGYRGEWVMHCRELGINTQHMPEAKTKEDAQGRAIAIVRNAANKLADDARKLGHE
jgi:hypothetical protein